MSTTIASVPGMTVRECRARDRHMGYHVWPLNRSSAEQLGHLADRHPGAAEFGITHAAYAHRLDHERRPYDHEHDRWTGDVIPPDRQRPTPLQVLARCLAAWLRYVADEVWPEDDEEEEW